jgi:hypothetical protein
MRLHDRAAMRHGFVPVHRHRLRHSHRRGSRYGCRCGRRYRRHDHRRRPGRSDRRPRRRICVRSKAGRRRRIGGEPAGSGRCGTRKEPGAKRDRPGKQNRPPQRRLWRPQLHPPPVAIVTCRAHYLSSLENKRDGPRGCGSAGAHPLVGRSGHKRRPGLSRPSRVARVSGGRRAVQLRCPAVSAPAPDANRIIGVRRSALEREAEPERALVCRCVLAEGLDMDAGAAAAACLHLTGRL